MFKKKDGGEDITAGQADQEGKKVTQTSWFKWIAGTILLLIALGFAFTRGNYMVAEPFIKNQLATVAAKLKAQSALSGDEVILTYGDVRIEGGIFNKAATVKDIRIDYTARLPFGNEQKTSVSTPIAVVTTDQISTDTIQISFPEPFKVERPGYQPMELSFDGKPVYNFAAAGGVEHHSMKLPSRALLNVSADKNDPIEVTIAYADGATFKKKVDHKQNLTMTYFKLEDVKITSNVESDELSLATVEASSDEKAQSEGPRSFSNKIRLAGLSVKKINQTTGPYDLVANVVGQYEVVDGDDVTPAMIDKVHMNIEELSLISPDYALTAMGDFNRELDDPMPYGHLDINVMGLDKLKSSPLAGVKDESLKNKVISAVLGADLVDAPNADFTIKREKQGTLFIGESTFENLVGVIVTHALSKQAGGSPLVTPVQPADTTPSEEPSDEEPEASQAADEATAEQTTESEAPETNSVPKPE